MTAQTDADLARLVADDLERYLEAVPMHGPAFGIALWINEAIQWNSVTAQYGVSIGSDADPEIEKMRASLANRAVPEEQWYRWPSSERWNSGAWAHIAEQFLSPETDRALEPLRELIRDEDRVVMSRIAAERAGGAVPDNDASVSSCDFTFPCACLSPGMRRWHEIGVQALTVLATPPGLPVTRDLLVFAEAPDQTRAKAALAMLRTITPQRLHDMFPAWRRMAKAVRTAREDETVMAELRLRMQRERNREPGAHFPHLKEVPPDELTGLLMACDLTWYDIITGSDGLNDALRIADIS